MIAVFGEALMDIVGDVPHAGGGPFNTARALARLGVPTAFVGRLSTDAYGRELASLLEQDGVDLSMSSFGPEPTTTAIVDVDQSGTASFRFRIDGTSAPNLTTPELPRHLPAVIRGIHVGTLGIFLEPIGSTVSDLVEKEGEGRLVMLDPNIRPVLMSGSSVGYRDRLEGIVAKSTIIKASAADLAWMYPGLSYEVAAERILANDRVGLVVVTLGSDGAFAATQTTSKRVEASRAEVMDTIGAGDAFGAALLSWLHDRHKIGPKLSLEAAELDAILGYACVVSALTCARAGADSPTRDEVIAYGRRSTGDDT